MTLYNIMQFKTKQQTLKDLGGCIPCRTILFGFHEIAKASVILCVCPVIVACYTTSWSYCQRLSPHV